MARVSARLGTVQGMQAALANAGTSLPFSLSRQIEADKRGYYAALQAGRRGAVPRAGARRGIIWSGS